MAGQIAVVIPYFQHNAGVLARTLAAVFAQDVGGRLDVIIADDASPAPAVNELAGLPEAARASIRIVQRRNGGPAAARNTGLGALPADAEFIALLDSDDLWQPQHLGRAMAAFDLGYDFYFSNHRRKHSPESRFSQCGVRAADHCLIDPAHALYSWKGDLFDTSLRATIVGMSTAVYRRAALPDARFDQSVGIVDDLHFVLCVARRITKIAFSPSEDVLYAEGDNLSAVGDWRSNKALRMILGYSLCYNRVLQDFSLSECQRMFLWQRRREIRAAFATTIVGMLASGKRINVNYAGQFLRDDPAVMFKFPGVLAGAIRKLAGTGGA